MKSKLQIQILSLYKSSLKKISKKQPKTQINWYLFIRSEFTKHLNLKKSNLFEIEYLYRLGVKRLDYYDLDSCVDVTVEKDSNEGDKGDSKKDFKKGIYYEVIEKRVNKKLLRDRPRVFQ